MGWDRFDQSRFAYFAHGNLCQDGGIPRVSGKPTTCKRSPGESFRSEISAHWFAYSPEQPARPAEPGVQHHVFLSTAVALPCRPAGKPLVVLQGQDAFDTNR